MKYLKHTQLVAMLMVAGLAHAADTYESKLSQLRADPDNYTWLQERSIEGVEFANEVLCIIKNTGADLTSQVNKGPYLAAVDKTLCSKSSPSAAASSGSQGAGNSAAKIYEFFVVDSTTDAGNLYVKIWIPATPDKIASDNNPQEVHAQFVFPLSRTGTDIGFSELNFKGFPVTSAGVIKPGIQGIYGVMKPIPTANGYTLIHGERWFDNNGVDQGGQWMNLSRTGTGNSVALAGFTKNMIWDNAQNKEVPVVFQIAANKNEFVRKQSINNGTTWDAPQCFDRNEVRFNTWNYTLFDKDSREVVGVNSNFQFRFNGNRGNYSSNGVWMPDTGYEALRGAGGAVTVDVEMDNNQIKSGILKMQNGGFRKVKNVATTLEQLTDTVFSVWVGGSNPIRLIWANDGGVKKFMTEATPTQPSAAYVWPQGVQNWSDLWLNTNGVGYRLSIPQIQETVTDPNGNWSYVRQKADFSALNDQSKATSRQEVRVTQTELAQLGNTTLSCVNNCPYFDSNGALVGVSANDVNAAVNTGSYPNNDSWFKGGKGYQYTYNATQGTLSATSGNTNPLQYAGFYTQWDQNKKGMTSGPLIPLTSKTLDQLVTASLCSWDSNHTSICGWESEKELPEYYVWRTGEMSWEKTWSLAIDGVVPTMEDPIMVKYTCPDHSYGCTTGTTLMLNYNGPKQLGGIPNRCVDSKDYTKEVDCNGQNIDKQWLNKFNLTKSPINADESKDFVVSATNSNKKYLILPQGSNEFYGVKNTCAEVTLSNSNFAPVNIDEYYNPAMTNIGAIPLDYKTEPVTVRDGVKLR